MYKIVLEKISSTHNNLRTDRIEGMCHLLPKVGDDFWMTAAPLDPRASIRSIRTTPVESIDVEGADVLTFKTANSVYRLSVTEEIPEAAHAEQ